jgi:hypothetical protein
MVSYNPKTAYTSLLKLESKPQPRKILSFEQVKAKTFCDRNIVPIFLEGEAEAIRDQQANMPVACLPTCSAVHTATPHSNNVKMRDFLFESHTRACIHVNRH